MFRTAIGMDTTCYRLWIAVREEPRQHNRLNGDFAAARLFDRARYLSGGRDAKETRLATEDLCHLRPAVFLAPQMVT